ASTTSVTGSRSRTATSTLTVGGVDTRGVVDEVTVHATAAEGELDPCLLGQPEVAALADHAAAQAGRVDPHDVVPRVRGVEMRLARRLHICADPTVPQQVGRCAEDGTHYLVRGECGVLDTEAATGRWRERELFDQPGPDA